MVLEKIEGNGRDVSGCSSRPSGDGSGGARGDEPIKGMEGIVILLQHFVLTLHLLVLSMNRVPL